MENVSENEDTKETLKLLHQTIRKVGDDVEDLKFNTAISQMMVFTNHCYKAGKVSRSTAETFMQVLAPFAPHLAEELWNLYGHAASVSLSEWPKVQEEFLVENTFEYPVSFNGKLRFKLELPLDVTKEEVEKAVLAQEGAQRWIEGKTIVKLIYVPGKIINVVVK